MKGPESYEIQVEGQLGDGWTKWFDGLTICHYRSGDAGVVCTVLRGNLDQAALHGVLMRIRGLAFWFVKTIEGSICPYCQAYEKVYGRKAHEPAPTPLNLQRRGK
jgi:hypothetical protein